MFSNTMSCIVRFFNNDARAREPGGGAVGATCPHMPPQLGSCGEKTLVCHCSSVLFFCCFCMRTWVSLKKNSGPNPGNLVLGRGYLGPRETFAPPPNFKVVPAPLDDACNLSALNGCNTGPSPPPPTDEREDDLVAIPGQRRLSTARPI